MRNLTVQVNVYNELKKLRDNVYSQYQFIYELVQNSQRAWAKNIQITGHKQLITFQDDGRGCKNFEKLFIKSETGWSKQVADAENPFGEGFFSTFAVADKMVIESHDKRAVVDVIDIVKNGNINSIVETDLPYYLDGFRVTLYIRQDMSICWDDFVSHVEKVAKFIKPEIILNNVLVEKEDFVPKFGNDEIAVKINEEGLTGFIVPSTKGRIKAYYQDRFVCNFDDDAEGRIKVDKFEGLKLKSPDRSEILWNNARYRLEKLIRDKKEELYTKVVKYASDEMIDEFEQNICYYVPAEKLREIVLVSEYGVYQKELEMMEEEAKNQENDIEEEPENNNFHGGGHGNNVYDGDRSVSYNVLTKFHKPKIRGQKVGVKIEQGFWVMADEIEKYLDVICKLRYHGVKIYVAKNKVQKKALEFLPHITKVDEEIKIQVNVKKLEAGNDTLNEVLSWVENLFNLKGGTIKYGDIEFYKVIGSNKVVENIEGFTDGYEIFLNKRIIRAFKYKRFGKKAFEWLLDSPVVHELAHLLYGTTDETIEHYKAEIVIMKKIVESYIIDA